MSFILEGIVLGLTLTILLGPIFIALTQTSIEYGARAGITVGLGIWISDFLIIGGCYFFINQLRFLEGNHAFKFWMGLIGGLVLIVFGFAAFLKKVEFSKNPKPFTASNYFGFLSKGFLVNTINPFTFFFWITVISTYIIGRGIDHNHGILFLSSIMMTIVITDTIKVILAKMIRKSLTENHVMLFSKVAGVALVIFGAFLLYRTSGNPF